MMRNIVIFLLVICALSAKSQSPRLMLYAVDSTLTSVITPFYISQVGMFGYYKDLIGKPSFSTVATTGSYSDLTGKPTIYTFTGTTAQYTDGTGAYKTFPTAVSSFTNDAGYLTNSSVPNLITKTANYTITGSDFASSKPAILHVWVDCSGGNVTLTLPSALTFAGYFVTVGKTDNTANTLTISGCSYDNIITVQNSVKELYSTSATWKQN